MKYLLLGIPLLFLASFSPANGWVECEEVYCRVNGTQCAYDNVNCEDWQVCGTGDDIYCPDGNYCGTNEYCADFNGTKCSDGVDNDCDGGTDLGDSNCPNYAGDDEGPEPPKCGGECCPPLPPAPTVDILCNGTQGPCTVAIGGSATLSWSSSDANSCSASNAWSGAKATAGSQSSGPVSSTSVFTLTCFGDGGTGQDSVVVQNPPNSSPTTSAVRATEPNYCTSAPSAFVEWMYSDPDGHAQGTYRVQIDDDPSFNSPAVDTGQVSCTSCRSYLSPTTLGFNTTYRARVQTTDSQGAASNWESMSLCVGPGCQGGGNRWTTPQHAYPSSVDFFWSPTNPAMNQLVQFTTSAVCYALGGNPVTCASWAWTFGDSGSSGLQNPTHTYTSEGSFPVTFSVTDGQGYQCPQGLPLMKNLSVQKKVPTWIEIAPR